MLLGVCHIPEPLVGIEPTTLTPIVLDLGILTSNKQTHNVLEHGVFMALKAMVKRPLGAKGTVWCNELVVCVRSP